MTKENREQKAGGGRGGVSDSWLGGVGFFKNWEINGRPLVWLIDHGDGRGPGNTAPSFAFKRLVTWRWNGHTILAGSCTFVHRAGSMLFPEARSSMYSPSMLNHWGLTLIYFPI